MITAYLINTNLFLPTPKIVVDADGLRVYPNPIFNEIQNEKIKEFWFYNYVLAPPSFKQEVGNPDDYKVILQQNGFSIVEVDIEFFAKVKSVFTNLSKNLSSVFLLSKNETNPAIKTIYDLTDPIKVLNHLEYWWSQSRVLEKKVESPCNLNLSIGPISTFEYQTLLTTDAIYRAILKSGCLAFNIPFTDKLLFDITITIKLMKLDFELPVIFDGISNSYVRFIAPSFSILITKDGMFEVIPS